MTTLTLVFRKDRPVTCGGCRQKFVPPDGPVLGVDDREHGGEIWPVVRCPNCRETVAVSWGGHVLSGSLS